jgi:hypothetical protein
MTKLYIVTVHGTGDDALLPDDARRWWQSESRFASTLNARIAELAKALGQSEPQVEWHRFSWDGANSKEARHIAGHRLFTYLRKLAEQAEAADAEIHVIAHSHGGNVLLEALLHAGREAWHDLAPNERKDIAALLKSMDPKRGHLTQFDLYPNDQMRDALRGADPFRSRLRSWITVGTPFLELLPHRPWNIALEFIGGMIKRAWRWIVLAAGFFFLFPSIGIPTTALLFGLGLLLHTLIARIIKRLRFNRKFAKGGATSLHRMFKEENYRRVHAFYGRRWFNLYSEMDEAVALLSRLDDAKPENSLPEPDRLAERKTGWGKALGPAALGTAASIGGFAALAWIDNNIFVKQVNEASERTGFVGRLQDAFDRVFGLKEEPELVRFPDFITSQNNTLLEGLVQASPLLLAIALVVVLAQFQQAIVRTGYKTLGRIIRMLYKRAFGDDGGYGRIVRSAESPGTLGAQGRGVGLFSELRGDSLPDVVETELFEGANDAAYETTRRMRQALAGGSGKDNNVDFIAFLLKQFNFRSLIHTSYFRSPLFTRMVAYAIMSEKDEEAEMRGPQHLREDRRRHERTQAHYKDDKPTPDEILARAETLTTQPRVSFPAGGKAPERLPVLERV